MAASAGTAAEITEAEPTELAVVAAFGSSPIDSRGRGRRATGPSPRVARRPTVPRPDARATARGPPRRQRRRRCRRRRVPRVRALRPARGAGEREPIGHRRLPSCDQRMSRQRRIPSARRSRARASASASASAWVRLGLRLRARPQDGLGRGLSARLGRPARLGARLGHASGSAQRRLGHGFRLGLSARLGHGLRLGSAPDSVTASGSGSAPTRSRLPARASVPVPAVGRPRPTSSAERSTDDRARARRPSGSTAAASHPARRAG